jgi:hypothetical protein
LRDIRRKLPPSQPKVSNALSFPWGFAFRGPLVLNHPWACVGGASWACVWPLLAGKEVSHRPCRAHAHVAVGEAWPRCTQNAAGFANLPIRVQGAKQQRANRSSSLQPAHDVCMPVRLDVAQVGQSASKGDGCAPARLYRLAWCSPSPPPRTRHSLSLAWVLCSRTGAQCSYGMRCVSQIHAELNFVPRLADRRLDMRCRFVGSKLAPYTF